MLIAHAAWSAPPSVDVASLLALVLFFHGWLRLRRRGRLDLADGKRAALFVAGLLVVLAGLLSPIHTIGENHLLWVHMLQHVLIGDLGTAANSECRISPWKSRRYPLLILDVLASQR